MRKIDIIGILLVWLFLAMLWVTCIVNLINGNYYGYRNYYGQPIGTLMLLVFLIVTTFVCLIMTIKTIRKSKVDSYTEPKLMNTLPSEWPWE